MIGDSDGPRDSEGRLFDTSAIRDDQGYWDALAERIAGNAIVQSPASGLDWLARSGVAWVTAPLAVAASLALIMLVPETSLDGSAGRLSQALAPTEAVARAMVSSDRPPDIASLLFTEGNRE